MMLVYVKYKDHLLYRNTDSRLLNPTLREAVGWLVKENDEALFLCFDRSTRILPHELPSKESGLIILKTDILERMKIG